MFADRREPDPVFLQRVGIDDREIDAAQIEQRIEVLRGAARDDGQDMQVRPIVDNARHLGRQAQRRALDQAGREANCPGVDLLLLLLISGRAPRRRCSLLLCGSLSCLQRQDNRR